MIWWKMVGRSVQLWVGTFFFLFGLVFTVIGVQEARKELVYRTQGLTVDATVLDKSILRAKRGENSRTRYLVTYRFTSAQGEEVEGAADVPAQEWERLEAGRKFLVTYLPGAPDSSRVSGEEDWIAALVFMAIGGVFALLGGGLAFSDLRAVLRAIRVSRHSLSTEGRVLRAEPTGPTINRVRQWRIHYQYRDHIGRNQEGQSHLLSPDEASVWHEGDTGAVRFDRERPQESVWIGHPQP